MKKLLYSALFLLAAFNGFSQDAASLKAGAQKVLDFTVKQDYNVLLDMTYPKIYDIAPREQMLESMKQTFEGNEGFRVKMVQSPPNFVFGDIKKIGNQSFAVINYDNAMQIIWDEALPADEVDTYIALFKENMKTNDITYDAPNKTMNIKSKAKMVAVADELTKKEWKYLTYNEQLFTMLFDEKIKTELGL